MVEPPSKRSSRLSGVTLNSAEDKVVSASQEPQEAVYLPALFRGFNFRQAGATEIWEDHASCIMMSENPANRPFSDFYLPLKTGRSPSASCYIITSCGHQVARAA